jgi:hypothetical protein
MANEAVGVPPRKSGPVFILGSARSGTSMLYSMLVSAGFANYRGGETHIVSMLGPRFGDLRKAENRARMLAVWEKSDPCTIAGLDMAPVRRKIMDECRSAGDFLRIFMDSVAEQRGAARWAEKTPEHLYTMPEIKRAMPDAKFVHVIRDGRDVALSLDKQGFIRPFPWDRTRALQAAALHWRWVISYGRKAGRRMGADYMEVHYEDLLSQPQQTLDRIGAFIGHELNHEEILRVGWGAVGEPNSSFLTDPNPMRRWQKRLTPEQLAELEYLIGPELDRQGYQRAATCPPRRLGRHGMAPAYSSYFTLRHWIKMNTPLSHYLVNLDLMRPGAIFGTEHFRVAAGG